MKKVTKGNEPSLLKDYRTDNPNDDWKKGFRGNVGEAGNPQVQAALIADQKGLCAYCEIDLKDAQGKGYDDFRVEHFFPENPKVKPDSTTNYALDWGNMLGCCTGGNSKYVVDKKSRFTSPDHSCDVPKENFDWVDYILNPLTDIPAFPCLFSYDEITGDIAVDIKKCPVDLQQKATGSIERLRLNAERLLQFRIAVFEQLNVQLMKYLETLDEDQALVELAADYFNNPEETSCPAFFTSIRWYLADAAEDELQTIGFDG